MAVSRQLEWIEGDLTREIISAFYTVYNALGSGVLESVYANALAIELRARGFKVEREVAVEVFYLGVQAGFFRLDLLVQGRIVVECKASEILSPAARPQVFNYLKATAHPVALLLHFGPTPKHYRYDRPAVGSTTLGDNRKGRRDC
jgi:GxxExxY protein